MTCRAGAIFLAAGSAAVLGACGSSTGSGRSAHVLSKPGTLAQLRQEAGRFLDGGPRLFKADLAVLRGHPVVVNQWASWCGPCRAEFPFFARVANAHRGTVAFLGDNAQDNRGDAMRFVRAHPVPYPHFSDLDSSIARLFRGGRAFPTTAYYNAAGKLVYTHPGAYLTAAALDADVVRYAING